jgi:hypothetical protein
MVMAAFVLHLGLDLLSLRLRLLRKLGFEEALLWFFLCILNILRTLSR